MGPTGTASTIIAAPDVRNARNDARTVPPVAIPSSTRITVRLVTGSRPAARRDRPDPPPQFLLLGGDDLGDVCGDEPEATQQARGRARRSAPRAHRRARLARLGDCAHAQLRSSRRPDLAGHEHVEVRMQGARHFDPDGHATSWQCEHHRVG